MIILNYNRGGESKERTKTIKIINEKIIFIVMTRDLLKIIFSFIF